MHSFSSLFFFCFLFCFRRCEFVTRCTTNIFENLICLQYKKGSIPLFQKLFLGILQKGKFFRWPFPAYPNLFSWKEDNCEVVVMNKEKIFIFSCTHFREFTRRLVLMARSCETWNRPIFIRATHRKFTQVQVIFFLLFFVLTRFYRVRCVSSFSRRTNNLPREEENFPKKEGSRKGRTGNQMFYLCQSFYHSWTGADLE